MFILDLFRSLLTCCWLKIEKLWSEVEPRLMENNQLDTAVKFHLLCIHVQHLSSTHRKLILQLEVDDSLENTVMLI